MFLHCQSQSILSIERFNLKLSIMICLVKVYHSIAFMIWSNINYNQVKILVTKLNCWEISRIIYTTFKIMKIMMIHFLFTINIIVSINFALSNKTSINISDTTDLKIIFNPIDKTNLGFENASTVPNVGDSTLKAILSYCTPYCTSSQYESFKNIGNNEHG